MINNRRSNYAVGTNDPVYSRRGYTGRQRSSGSHDYIPGVNVKNAVRQIMPWNWGKNLNIFDNYSTDDGPGDERRPMANPDGSRPWFGKTETNSPSLSENRHFGTADATSKPALSSSRGQSGSSSMTYDPKAVAWLDQQLARFPGLYRNIENNRQNRLKRNAEDYELYRQDTEDQYNQAKRNFEFEKSQRLKTREKRLAGNDASYKNQMDQWQRYLGMMGVGRSSTAQVTVPDALSREATLAKDQIEDENALNATKSQLSWDETERRRSRTLADLINNKNRADDETNAQFDGLVAGQKEKEAQLQRERGQAQGRTIGSILNSTQPLVNEADRLNSQASTYGSQRTMVKPDVNVKYDAINPDKFRLDRNQNNINTEVMAGDPNNDMTRNVEEEKKKRYRTLGSLIGA